MSQEFSDALNDCLDRLVRGDSVSECLRRYPDRADELEPLLYVAQATIRAAESAKPDAQAKARNFERFSQAIGAMQQSPQPAGTAGATSAPRRSRWDWRDWMPWRWMPAARPVAIAMVGLLVLALGAGGASAASEDAVPGEALYWVKTTRESVERRIPRSDDSRAIYETRLANARGDEICKLIERGHFTRADVMTDRMKSHLALSAYYAGVTATVNPIEMPVKPTGQMGQSQADYLRVKLEGDREAYRAKVESILSDLSPDDRQRAERLIRRTELGYWLLIEAMQTGSPNSRYYYIVKTPHRGWPN